MVHHDHDIDSVGFGLVTVSSTRTIDNDPSGDWFVNRIADDPHRLIKRTVVDDQIDPIQSQVIELARREEVNAIVTTGGTGITPDDVTIEALRPTFQKTLPGFGERFRARSTEDIGSRVIATRATAGVVDQTLVFALPGSRSAVRLATNELILPTISHLAGLVNR